MKRTNQVFLASLLAVFACDEGSPGAEPEKEGAGGKADDASQSGEPIAFQDCFDHDGVPDGAATRYRIGEANGAPALARASRDAIEAADPGSVYTHIVEDVRFTTYKCWDEAGGLTGFDIEMITEAAAAVGFDYIEFVPRTWDNYVIGDREYLTLLIDLVVGLGDGLSAGMSITEERLAIVDMVGPIYKAGKKLMARNDNSRISAAKLEAMLRIPGDGYDSLAGLTVLVQASSIRGDFFRELEAARPDLVEYLSTDAQTGQVQQAESTDKLQVLEVDSFEIVTDFIDSGMSEAVSGVVFDLVMIDTGSTKSLIAEGKLGKNTQIVTANLSADPELGAVFGTGDGISFAKSNPELSDRFRPIIANMAVSGRVDELIEKWFADDNAADLSWAEEFGE